MSEITAALSLECRGMHCPLPVVQMKIGLSRINVGEILEIIATDPATEKDIPPAARALSAEIVKQEKVSKIWVSKTGEKYNIEYRYYIRRLK
ncbi:MAG: sulfurtransferase TusA family protein [Euryarchaeota archaeon]|nr:sulfurtransferase TusA family protein [Euryarchaeota archaeon]